jgi:hypothetical protein
MRAFISTGIVEIVPQKEIDKQQNPDGSFEGLPPLSELKVYADSGLAKFESFTMMRDPALAGVNHSEHVICLN